MDEKIYLLTNLSIAALSLLLAGQSGDTALIYLAVSLSFGSFMWAIIFSMSHKSEKIRPW